MKKSCERIQCKNPIDGSNVGGVVVLRCLPVVVVICRWNITIIIITTTTTTITTIFYRPITVPSLSVSPLPSFVMYLYFVNYSPSMFVAVDVLLLLFPLVVILLSPWFSPVRTRILERATTTRTIDSNRSRNSLHKRVRQADSSNDNEHVKLTAQTLIHGIRISSEIIRNQRKPSNGKQFPPH